MEKIDALKARIEDLNKTRNEHAELRSTHDKRAREIEKDIRKLEKELIGLYGALPATDPKKK